MTRDEFLARRRAAAEQQDEETTAQRPAVSSAASTGMTREEFLERRRAGMEAAEQQTSTSVSRPTSVSPDTDSTLRRLAASKEQNRKPTRAGLEETRTGSGRQLPGASGKLGDMLLDATRYQQAHKTGPSGEDALAYGVMSGTGAASLAALAGRALTGERADWYNDYQREAAEAAQEHPTAYGVGNVGGSLGIAYATGGLAGAATGALLTGEGAATAAGTVIKGLARNAMTFAMTDAIHNAGAFAADSMSDRDFINSMGVGMAQGAAGGLAAGLVNVGFTRAMGKAAETIAGGMINTGAASVLKKYQLWTPFTEFLRQTAAGTASAGANIATGYALRENKPTKEQMAKQFTTAFLLSMLQGAISTYETTMQNRAVLQQYINQMGRAFQQMEQSAYQQNLDLTPDSTTPGPTGAWVDSVREMSNNIRMQLNTTGYMPGQAQRIGEIYEKLDAIDSWLGTLQSQSTGYAYDTPVSPYNDAMLGSGEDIVPQLTEAITTGMTEGANQPPTPPVPPETPVDTTIAAAGAQTPAPPEVSPETEEALRALTEQPDVLAAPETPQEPEIETPEEVIPPEPETPAAPEPEPEPEPAAEPETVSPAQTLRQNAEAGGLGKKGQQAIGDFYSGGMEPEQLTQYYAGFSAYYKAGGDGVPVERVRSPFADALSEQAKIGAWSSGRADALAEGRTIPEPEPMPAAPETAVAQTEPSGYNEITEQPKPEAVQPEPMTTAETAKPTVEQAKEDLKRAIQVPVQTGNLDALREAIKSGELSPDVVTLGSKVPGFTREQQKSLAQQIIEGQQDGKEVIHADVPGDGRFDINTSDQDAVPKVLNALHVKVNQEAVITKDIDSWLKRSGKSGRSYVGRADDQYFLSDGYAAVRVPKTTADYALKEPAYKARMEDFRAQLNAAKVASGTLEEPRRGKMTVKGQATQVYAFRTADGVLAFPKDAFNKIDGGTLSYGPMGRGFIAVSRGEDGEVRAFALALDPKTFRQEDYNGFAPVKIKATLAADTSTDNSLPAAGAQGAAREKEADNGGVQGRTEEVGKGRGVSGGGGPGRPGSGAAETVPEAGRGLQGSGDRGPERVPENERLAGPAPGSGLHAGEGLLPGGDDRGAETEAGRAVPEQGAGEGRSGVGSAPSPDGGGRSGGPAVKQKRRTALNKNNYRITEDIDSSRPNFSDNYKAIQLIKTLEKESRPATAEERGVLARYKGWGGLKDAVLNANSYQATQLKRLLTPEEFSAARDSVLNAHYTSTKVISAIYDGVQRLGFDGGRVLEPSMGVGNFFGVMPEKLTKRSELYGVELDSITGKIAQNLYPDAKIDVAGFQDVLYPDNTFDLVIGNVPFSNQIHIPYRGSTYNLHDFFFVKALDETRPGGMVALITSTGTLDKISGKTQSEIAKRANLIAAFRLPDDAFRVNAGTSVTTDLIFLQKKGPGDESNGIEFGKIGKIDGIPINEYYVEHPKNVLGELAFEKGMYAGERTVVHATPGVNFQERLAAAMKTLPRNVMNEGAENKAPVRAKKRGERKRTTFVMTEDGAQITDKDTGEVIRYEEGTKAQKEKVDTIRDYIKVKTAFDGLVNAERSGNLEAAEDFRKKLNREYDDFAEKHGPILFNKRLLAADDDFVRMTGLELQSKEGVSKSAIFTRLTISKAKRTSAGSSDEALSIVLNEEGRVDVPRMAALTGRTEQQVLEDLAGEIIFTPDGDYVLTAQYASGNIYEKLAAIEGREGFEEQRKVLEAALPKKKGVGEIRASLGAHWIAPKYVREFLQETFNPQYGSIDVQYSRELGKWQVNHFWTTSKKYSTDSMEAWKVAEGTLNGKNLTVYDKDADGRRITNRDETAAVQQKQADLRNAFEEWVFRDKERADDLIDTYNRTFNAVAPMDYADLGQRIDFGLGPDAKKQPRDYQKTAVARIVFGGNTLLHHGVGTGKTLDMILAAHVMKQNGTAQKPLFVVPNGKVNDFRNEILEVYPDASILALDNETMSPKQLQRTKAQIATGDWDYVLVYRSAFERLAVSPETEARFLQQQLDMFEEAIRDSAGERNGTNRFEKSLIGRKKTLEERIKKTLAKPKDETTYFEDMGIDALFVDEAHNFKKVGFPTSFEISGIDSSSNQITTDLYMKENYLRDRGGKIVLATATPITNTLSEMYNMALHVAPEVYESAGIYTFDTWLNTFGQIESQPEIAPDGKTWRMKERVRGFRNGNEMVGLYRQFADVVQTKDVVKGLPEAEFIDVVSPATELNQKLLDSFADRATRAGRRGDKGDNMLQITNDGRAAGTDLRLLTGVIGEMFPDMKKSELDVPTSKINKCVQLVAQEYKDSADIKGTQFIFLDLGVNDGGKRYSFNLYKDLIAKLEKAGIPRSEIANIQDYDGEDRRSELYDKMNSGELRVLIGSTAKMGEGVNAQERAVALHHLNVPYRPDNLEQREGRIIRFGNINKKVRIYRYIQEKSFDSYMWQMIERKAAYTAQALAGGDATDLEEVGDIELKAREAKGIATGNPLIVEKMKLQDQAEKLRAIYRNWQGERYSAARNADRYREEIPRLERAIEKIKQDIRTVEQNRSDEFRITIGGKTYDSRKDAIKPLNAMLKPTNMGKTIGSINGLDIVLHEPYLRDDGDYAFTLRGAYEYSGSFGNSEDGNLTRVTNKGTKGPEDELKRAEADLAYDRRALKDAEEMQKGAFPQQEELDRVTARQLEVDRELGITENEEAVELGQDDGDAVHASIDPTGGMPHPERWTAERVGDREKQAKSLSEIMEQIRHDFGINITKGHIRGRGVMGQYDDSNRGMRIRSANDLPTSVHELGHHLDNVYKFSESLTAAEKKELLDQLPEELKARYKEKEQPGEGVAEFVRRFMTNRTTAALDYPEFTKKFLNTMNGHDRALVEQLADEVNAALALDVDTATSSIRLREDGRPDARTIREKVNDMFHVAYQAFTDSLHGIKLFDEATGSSVYKLASNAAYVDNIAGQIVIGDLTDMNGQYVGPGLKTVLTGLDLKDNDTYMKFGEYLVVKHGPERLAEGMRIFADDRKNSEAFMNRRQQELEQEHPEFIEISDRLYEFQRQLLETWGVATGLLSQDQVDSWLKRWAYYVPFNRAVPVESRGLRGKRGFANQTSPFKKAVGSGLDIIHPVDSIIGHVAVLVNNGMKNNVARSLADAARNTPANAQLIEKIPTPMIPHKIGLKGVKQGIEDTAEMLLEKELIGDQAFLGIEAILHSMQDFMMQYTRQQPHGNIITVMRDGRPEYWKVNDPLLLRSLADMSPAKQEGFLAAYGMISRVMTTNITGMNVVWSIFSNAPRDLGTFFGYSKERNPLKVFPAIASAYANKANMSRGKDVDPLYKEYLAMGGGAMSMYSADRKLAQKARKQLAQTSISANPLEWIRWMGDLIEQGPRYATYKLMRLRGMSPAEAFYEATDITVNFRRGGRLSRELNKLFPFFNAGVQGMDKFARYFGAFDVPPGGPPKGPGLTGGDAEDGGEGPGGSGRMPRDERSRVRRSRMMWYLIASAIAAAVSFAINHLTKDREEDYKRLSNWTKNNYFLVPIGDGRYFAISKPRELGVLSSFMESATERVLMDDKHAMDGFYEYATDVMLPGGVAELAQGDLNGVVGSMGIFGVGAYLNANRDFLGRPIVSNALTHLEPRDRYNDRTSKMGFWLGQAFNQSPQKIDFFFEQTLGGLWKYQKAVFPVASENRDLTLGVYNQYIKDSQYSTDLLNRMYDRTEASEMAKNSDPDDMDKAIWYKMDNNLSTFYGRFYKLSKEDSRSEQARAARKAVLEMINEYEITRESGQDPTPFESVWGEVFDVVRETGKTELLPKVLNPLIKSEKGYGTDLNAQQYLEYQTKYNDLYADIVADALQNARNDSEKYALIAKANEVAQERAQDYMLKRLGVPETSAIEAKYGDVSDADIATFQALLYLAGQDGGVTNAEAAQAIDRMRREGLNREDAGQLYYSQTKSESDEKLLSTGVSVGLTESDIGLFHLAVRDADKPSKSGKYGTYTAEEYENAIRATPGLTREQRDFLYMKYAATKAKPNPPRW